MHTNELAHVDDFEAVFLKLFPRWAELAKEHNASDCVVYAWQVRGMHMGIVWKELAPFIDVDVRGETGFFRVTAELTRNEAGALMFYDLRNRCV